MDSSGWLKILNEAAKNVHTAMKEARLKHGELGAHDFKQVLDEVAQHSLIETLNARGVSASLISEEGNVLIREGGLVVIADPIDGTTNLARGLPPAATCISVSENGKHSGTLAAVVKNIYTGETYAAELGKGAMLDGRPIRVAAPKQARSALIATGISKNPKLDRVAPLLNTCRYLRMLGSSAFELSLIASGNLDAHVDVRGTLRATDVAAALTILKEAGGVYAVDGVIHGDFPLTKETVMEVVAASNLPLLDDLLALTKGS